MKVMYVASRYHSNQIPIVKGWLESGDEVCFVVQFKGGSEDYSLLTPVELGYSKGFKAILAMYKVVRKKAIAVAGIPQYFQAQFGFPAKSAVVKLLGSYKPDVVILRDRCVYNAVITKCCRKMNIKTILYNQTPFYETEPEKTDLAHRVIRGACPSIRMTPVLGTKNNAARVTNKSHYVPFVIEVEENAGKKQHLENGQINIVCVGKYEKRKHHKELVTALLHVNENWHLTLIGECSRDSHKKYVEELKTLIADNKLNDRIDVLMNIKRDEVYSQYFKADLFVLPSTGEFASISQLEAMSCGLPAICSSTNGTADCIHNGENGYIFEDRNFDDLSRVLVEACKDRDRLISMGSRSIEIVNEEYNFARYKNSILEMMKEC